MSHPRLTVTVDYHAHADLVLTLAGVLDHHDLDRFEDRVLHLAQGARTVVVELSGVARCDCRLLTLPDRVRHRLQPTACELRIQGLDPQTLNFDRADLPTVLAAYRASPTATPDPAPTHRQRAAPASMPWSPTTIPVRTSPRPPLAP